MKIMPAEWEKQRAVLLSFPHEETDWAEGDLNRALTPFIRIARPLLTPNLSLSSAVTRRRSVTIFAPKTI